LHRLDIYAYHTTNVVISRRLCKNCSIYKRRKKDDSHFV